ncbi:phospholipase, patatin family domain protein [Mycobacterium xenopi 4042]|uniref:Phospholipase, patatin family domain protein n=1 Tax=Mycobacterium xenopi 4042 TaxID=1299334 RepID=X8BKU3_MYCXE|nr:phospholipase, patatin family domain protein [Mycobacterium xenopi 4042]
MDAGYSVQRVAGVSAGSVVGAILAAASKGSQLTAEEITELALSVPLRKWRDAGRPCRRICGGLLRQTSMYRATSPMSGCAVN